VAVTEQQLRELVPESETAEPVTDAELEALLSFLDCHEVATRSRPRKIKGGWQVEIECPLRSEHQSEDSQRDAVVTVIGGQGFGFKCLHGHCEGRDWKKFRTELESRAGRKFAFASNGLDAAVVLRKGLPLITHATLAEAFLRDNHDFVCVYDVDGRPIAQWVGTRWEISRDDTLVWRAVADYLKSLHGKYDKPEKSRPDSRLRLYDATFTSGVVRCVKPYLRPVKADVFDSNPHMLGLPNCRVIDLQTGAIRETRRDDYISQRIDGTPDANCATPRFDQFIGEITCGDAGLANYLLRLCALCLTALPFQALFFLWGRGRNGKGVDSDADCDSG
jgi:D5 N terminal like